MGCTSNEFYITFLIGLVVLRPIEVGRARQATVIEANRNQSS